MKKALQQYPLFLLLLPVFFVFHGLVVNYPFVRFGDCWGLLGIYLLATLLVFLLALWILRSKTKAALLAFFILSYYFFFGALHDGIRSLSPWLARYTVLLPGFLMAPVVLGILLRKRKKPFTRLILFLNCLFFVFLITDGVTLAWKSGRNLVRYTGSPLTGRQANFARCDTCSRPDIYLLLFDGYCANRTLKEVFHYDNGALDSFLVGNGFHIQKKSRSNYNHTPFSMASMLNLSYLTKIRDPLDVKPADDQDMFEPIRTSEAVNFLISKGYSIFNYSPFDLPGHPCILDQPFIPVKTKLITHGTLTDYIIRDLSVWIDDHLRQSSVALQSTVDRVGNMNDSFLAGTIGESARSRARPRFVYTHVFLPHFPYIYDSALKKRRLKDIDADGRNPPPKPYLDYLTYTNVRLRQLVTAIKDNSKGRAVILFMSDHGFRYPPDGKVYPYFFNNQNAVYFPDGDYSMMYDSITNVNQFRVVFNKLFRLNLPLLKDSVIFLREKP